VLPDVVTVSNSNITRAEEVFGKMKSASELQDVVNFNSLIGGGRTQHGETKKVEDNCEKMRSAGALPGVVTFNSLDTKKAEEQKTSRSDVSLEGWARPILPKPRRILTVSGVEMMSPGWVSAGPSGDVQSISVCCV
jgi:hypothetical protein